MIKTTLILSLTATLAIQSARAQAPSRDAKPSEAGANPLSEKELLNTLDALGTGDPVSKQPLGVELGDQKLGLGGKKEKPTPKDKGPTEITALDATFDQKSHQAVFTGKVVVKDPEFNVVCDRLTALLKQEKAAGKPTPGPAVPSPGTPSPAPKKGKEDKSGGLQRAIAEADEGKRVIITQEKVEADGSTTRYIGKAEKADYDAGTGDIILTGWPEVQQGINSIVAEERATIITLNRDGRMKTRGKHKTVIKDQGPETTAR